MLRILKLIVLVALAAVLILFVVLNMELVDIRWLPADLVHSIFPDSQVYDFAVRLPLAFVILLSVLAGMILGYLMEWVREHKHRRTARVKRREAETLEAENRQLKRKLDDDDLPRIAAR